MIDPIHYYQSKLAFEIDSWDLHKAINSEVKVVVIDVRSLDAYLKEHIPSAISLPHRSMNIENTNAFNKDVLYVCYCDGIGCNGSTKGALNMAKLGFKVKELIGGLDWWKRDGYDTRGENGKTENKIQCAC